MSRHDDDRGTGRILARREALALLGTTAGVAVLGAWRLRAALRRWRPHGPAVADAAEPCVVRPEQTEGPYFVDARLDRSDIRSDPGTGAISDGTPLTLTFVLQRLDGGSCVPLAGALVDLWHCDARGVYSGVQDPGFDTTGQQFLRGYQLTDADGVARFVTIYPGWYPGRTVHMHVKLRTDPDASTGFEFTSQLYFDDSVTDVVHARQPYAARGQRTLRNAGDGIYADGGSALLLTVNDDGAGGFAATFDVSVALDGTTSCASIDACVAALEGTLPDPAASTTRKAARTARVLIRRMRRLAATLGRASTASPARQEKLYARSRKKLAALVARSRAADADGMLGVPLLSIETAAGALLAVLPA